MPTGGSNSRNASRGRLEAHKSAPGTHNVDKRRKKANDPNGNKFALNTKAKIIIAAASVALVLIVCMIVNIAIGIREIEVKGAGLCTPEEIISTAGIEEGKGYFSYNVSKSEKKIKELFPCVVDINISRSVFGKVTVNVTERKALWYIESYDEYFALSEELEVIKNSDSRDRFISCGLVKIDFPEVRSAVLGKPVEIADENRDCQYVVDFLHNIRESEMYEAGRIDHIKIKNKFEVCLVVDLKYLVVFGNCSDVDSKLSILKATTENAMFEGNETWEVNVSSVTNASARKDHELDFSYLKPVLPE